ILNERSTARPSEVIEETENEFRIATIDYDIILYKDLLELLFSACRNAAPEDVIMRLISNPIDLNTKNANGWSVLMVAAYNYHKVAVELLVKNGANVNQSNYKGTTILMYAKSAPSRGRDLSMIKWLIEKGADINARDKSGRTILSYARSDGDFDLAGLLIGYGGCE
ncbi:MAG: ankyrin repeat domain-containing protein, partial [Kiritimatiellales bacterium]